VDPDSGLVVEEKEAFLDLELPEALQELQVQWVE
jgi:hypothetical protein